MAKCQRSKTDVLKYLMKDFSSEEERVFLLHLQSCLGCRAEYERLSPVIELMQADASTEKDISNGDDFVLQLNQKLDTQRDSSWLKMFGRFPWWYKALGMGILTLLVLSIIHPNQPRPVILVRPTTVSHKLTKSKLPNLPKLHLGGIRPSMSLSHRPGNISDISMPEFPRKPDVNIKSLKFKKINKS